MNNNKTILVGGMMQSGSHLLYNIVRNLLEELDYGVECRYPHNKYRFYSKSGKDTFILDKSHSYINIDNNPPDYCIVSYRDIRDTASSWSLKRKEIANNKYKIVQRAIDNVSVFDTFKNKPNLNSLYWRYEDYKKSISGDKKNHTWKLFENLFRFLELDIENYTNENLNVIATSVINHSETISKNSITEHTLRSFREQGKQCDVWNKTGMLKDHISQNNGKINGFITSLDRDIVIEIEKIKKSRDFLISNGYELLH